MVDPKEINWQLLSESAWEVRKNASIIGKTMVGAAVLSVGGKIYVGCNVEQRYRNHDVHAEVNAISNMISHGEKNFVAILIAAEREKFTPCGSCLDWIFQFGGRDAFVAFQPTPTSSIEYGFNLFSAGDLMPHYPN